MFISIPSAIFSDLCFSAGWSCVEKASIFSRCARQAENKARGAIIALLLAKRFANPRTMKTAAGDHRVLFSRSFALFTRARVRMFSV